MQFNQEISVAVPVDRVWEFLMDVPAVASCIPGVEAFEELDDDRYHGTLRVRIGPVSVRLEGDVDVVERDAAARRARMRANATDRFVRGGVNATLTMVLTELDESTTNIEVTTDAQMLGRLGEFGQSIIRRKADQILNQFAARLTARLTDGEAEDPA